MSLFNYLFPRFGSFFLLLILYSMLGLGILTELRVITWNVQLVNKR